MKKISLFILGIMFFTNVFSNTFYIDPVNGSALGNGTIVSPWKTLEEVISNDLIESNSFVLPYDQNNPLLIPKNTGAPIQAGDTLMLYTGLHGTITLVNYINNQNIVIMNVPDNTPVFNKLHLQSGKNWIIQGVEISSEPYGNYINDKLVFLESHNWQGPVSNIRISDCKIYSTTTPWQDSTSWITKVSDGIIIRGDSVYIFNNEILNIGFGISMRGDYITSSGNTITNFSADGIRLVGSNSIVEKNIIKNCYSVDSNHDDGIQSFTTGGLVVDNNIVRQNIILNYEDPNQPLLGDLQGIGCFDGPFNNWTVENNLVVVNHWHGISFYGLTNSEIINNTVLDPTPAVSPGPSWIKIEDLTGYPSSGCIMKNNVTNDIIVTSNTTTGNNATLPTLSDYALNFVDHSAYDFHLIQSSPLIDVADNTISPAVDLDDNVRPSGIMPDIGAYEYQHSSSINDVSNEALVIYPNPIALGSNIVINDSDVKTVRLFDTSGRLIYTIENTNEINTDAIGKGMFIIYVESTKIYRQKILIN